MWMIHGPASLSLSWSIERSAPSTFMYGIQACDTAKGPVRFVSTYL